METLAERLIHAGKLDAVDAVTVTARLAQWIRELHSIDEIHGAISTEAIVLPQGDLKRAALRSSFGSERSASFESPERLDGAPTSKADDVWAIGAVLYATLTGHNAFAGSTDEKVLARIRSGGVAPLAVFDVGDDDLAELVGTVLAVDRPQRTATAMEVHEALEGWLVKRGLTTGAMMDTLEDGTAAIVDLGSVPPPPGLAGLEAYGIPKAPKPFHETFDEDTTLPREIPPHLEAGRTPAPTAPLADRLPPTSELLARAKSATSRPPPRLSPPRQVVTRSNAPPPLPPPNPPPIKSTSPPLPPPTPPPIKSVPPPLPPPNPPPIKSVPPPLPPATPPPVKSVPPPLPSTAPPAKSTPAPAKTSGRPRADSKPPGKGGQRRSQPPASKVPPRNIEQPELPSAPRKVRPSEKRAGFVPIVATVAVIVVGAYVFVRFSTSDHPQPPRPEPAPTAVASAAPSAVSPSLPRSATIVTASASVGPVASIPTASALAPSASASSVPATPPSTDREACLEGLLAEGSVTEGAHPDFRFVCDETDPRKGAPRVRSLVVVIAKGHVTDAMHEWAVLGSYELAAFAAMRGRCCPSARPLELPPSPGSCPSMQDALTSIASAAHAGANETDQNAAARAFRDALLCIEKSGRTHYLGDYPPVSGGQDTTFMKTFLRTRQ